jgi:hypothetical protein
MAVPACTVSVSPPLIVAADAISLAAVLLGPPLLVGTPPVVTVRVDGVLEDVTQVGQLKVLGGCAVHRREHQ